MKVKICILGAGLCGLSTGFFLKKSNIDNFFIIEQNSCVGGTSRTIKKNGWEYDLTGHALHLKNEFIKKFLYEELNLKNDIIYKERESSVFINNKFIPYPFQHNLAFLPSKLRDKAILDFLKSYFSKKEKDNKKYTNFSDYCYSKLGKSITDLFMNPYNEKLWATSGNEMGIDWMGRFVPEPKLQEILNGAFEKNINKKFYKISINQLSTKIPSI